MFKTIALFFTFMFAAVGFAQNPQSQTAPIFSANAKYVNGVAPGYAPCGAIGGASSSNCNTTSGLNLAVGAGGSFCGTGVTTYAGGTLALTANATNNVYLDSTSSCAVSVKTGAFVATDIPIAVVVTGASTITSISDSRTMFTKPSAGGGAALPSNAIVYGITSSTSRAVTAGDVGSATFGTGGGTAQAQTAALNFPISSLSQNLTFTYVPTNSNSAAAPTLSVDGLTATVVTKCGSTALVAGDIASGIPATVRYIGSGFQLNNPQVAGCGSSGGGTPPGSPTNLVGYSALNTPSALPAGIGLYQNPLNAVDTEFINSGFSGVDCIPGDSLGQGFGMGVPFGWCSLAQKDIGGNAGTNYTVSGSNSADASVYTSIFAPTIVKQTGNALRLMQVATNNAGKNTSLNMTTPYSVPARLQFAAAMAAMTTGTDENFPVTNTTYWTKGGTNSWALQDQLTVITAFNALGSGYANGDTSSINCGGSPNPIVTISGVGGGIPGSAALTTFGAGCPSSGANSANYTTTAITGTGSGMQLKVDIGSAQTLLSNASGNTLVNTSPLIVGTTGYVYLPYCTWSFGTGTFTVTVDGGSPLTDFYTGLSTLSSARTGANPYSVAGWIAGGLSGQEGCIPQLAKFNVTSSTPHTFTITTTNSGQTGFFNFYIPSTAHQRVPGGPNLTVGGTPPERGGVFSANNTFYSQMLLALVNDFRNDGRNIAYADQSNLDPNRDFLTGTSGQIIQGCQVNTDSTTTFHPDQCGYQKIEGNLIAAAKAIGFGPGNLQIGGALNLNIPSTSAGVLGVGLNANGKNVNSNTAWNVMISPFCSSNTCIGLTNFGNSPSNYAGPAFANGALGAIITPTIPFAILSVPDGSLPTDQTSASVPYVVTSSGPQLPATGIATSGATLKNSTTETFNSSEWNGTAAVTTKVTNTLGANGTSPAYKTTFSSPGFTGNPQVIWTNSAGGAVINDLGNGASAVKWNWPTTGAYVINLQGGNGTVPSVNVNQTTTACSTSGNVIFSEPFVLTTYKKVIAYANACLGTVGYTFPTAFTNVPAITTTNGPASSVVTALSTTAMTITGATTTGFILIDGY